MTVNAYFFLFFIYLLPLKQSYGQYDPGATMMIAQNNMLYNNTIQSFVNQNIMNDLAYADHSKKTPRTDSPKIAAPADTKALLIDGKYLAITANSRAGVPGSGTTAAHLCLVPADGQVYKVWPGEDKRVIQVAVQGENVDSEGLGKAIVGDFVWR